MEPATDIALNDAESLTAAYNERVAALAPSIEKMKEVLNALSEKQDKKTSSEKKDRTSIFMTGPTSTGKTEAVKAMAAAMFNSRSGKDNGVIIFDEPHKADPEALAELIALATGQPSGRKLGDIAAQTCHDGLPENITPMKPLQIRRGFSWVM
jgi:ATP-dependent Clp protease ATP-binding subunit ClpA